MSVLPGGACVREGGAPHGDCMVEQVEESTGRCTTIEEGGRERWS